jgi:hypothetical protein
LGSRNISKEEIINYFGHSLRYSECYAKGDSILLAQMAVKKKSHRTIKVREAFVGRLIYRLLEFFFSNCLSYKAWFNSLE